ncbi:MAG: AmmeMemoRadiSam system protein A [Bacilli bacterium]|jgi:AmmeMemoRadiSam system protein A/AmmeMemoRadiSam system protein B
MSCLMGYYLMPHPPIIIPEVGRGEEKKIKNSTQAAEKVALDIKRIAPETIVVITPHGLMFRDAISVSYDLNIAGSLYRFGAPSVTIKKEIDLEVVDKLAEFSKAEGIPLIKFDQKTTQGYNRAFELDHGTLIPLYFIEKEYTNYKIVHITYSLLSDFDLFRFGNLIKESLKSLNRKAVIIASGDLSHRLTKDGPYPYSPRGKEFDKTLIDSLKKGDLTGIMKLDEEFAEEAGECGLRSVRILLGALNTDFKGELLSYEGPFGVGYGVMKLIPHPTGKDYLKIFETERAKKNKKKREGEDMYVKLARKSIGEFLKTGKIMPVPDDLPKEILSRKGGVFVTLKKHGYLRGCIGTYLPTRDSLVEEIIHNAVSAAFQDPRFNPLHKSEFAELDISVDILSTPVKAKKEELNPKIYGVIVSSGYKRGLLLPDLEGVNTASEQLRIACEKAGIPPNSNYEIYKFTVERHGDKS